jgi:sporulation protein YlmC with PRC-barrel domain
MSKKSSRFWKLRDLLDWTARDIGGRPVGRVADVIIDPAEGRVAYLSIRLNPSDTGVECRITVPWSVVSRVSESHGDIWIAARESTLQRLGSASTADA